MALGMNLSQRSILAIFLLALAAIGTRMLAYPTNRFYEGHRIS
jgi:hypothetical protein